jgi:hypothetical protein
MDRSGHQARIAGRDLDVILPAERISQIRERNPKYKIRCSKHK